MCQHGANCAASDRPCGDACSRSCLVCGGSGGHAHGLAKHRLDVSILLLQDLKEQVRDLMVFVEASQMAGQSEIAGGNVQVGPSAKPKRRSRR